MEIRGYKCAKYSIILLVFAPYGIVYKVIFFHFCQPKLSVQVSALTVFLFSVVFAFFGVFAGNKKAAKCRFVWLFLRCKNISRI